MIGFNRAVAVGVVWLVAIGALAVYIERHERQRRTLLRQAALCENVPNGGRCYGNLGPLTVRCAAGGIGDWDHYGFELVPGAEWHSNPPNPLTKPIYCIGSPDAGDGAQTSLVIVDPYISERQY